MLVYNEITCNTLHNVLTAFFTLLNELVKGEIFHVIKLNLLQNDACLKNDKRLADKADTLPPLYVSATGHQFSHPLTMFDSISPTYAQSVEAPLPDLTPLLHW